MKTATFPCPHCSSPLRIRDRAFVEREVGCPECGERLEVTLDADREPIAHKILTEKPEAAPPPGKKRKKKRGLSQAKKKKPTRKPTPKPSKEDSPHRVGSPSPVALGRKPLFELADKFPAVPDVLFSPVSIAWMVAGMVGLILLIMAWPTGEPVQATNPPATTQVEAQPKQVQPPEESDPLEEEIPSPPPPNVVIGGNEDQLIKRMQGLGQHIQDSVDRRGRYPNGTVLIGDQPAEDRFSWLAELLVQSAQKRLAEPQWDQPWHDPLNDRFVRQQRDLFLNPLLSQRVGSDRYPATHFVGVAGVGADAPQLPVDHPRAGIFGIDRITREKDIRDGLAETMMVAGVSERLGSWAAAGPPSMRAFTQEPYIEGPDGFGTGQAEGMSVLMADGSVRFLNQNTDPAIIRQMAAMADQSAKQKPVPSLPPGQPPSPETQPPPAIVQAQPKPKTVIAQKPETDDPETPPPPEEDVPKPAPPKPVDIPAALAVKLVKFEQIQAAPFEELLFQVEEMSGVPLQRGDDLPERTASLWSQPVSLTLKDTTVGQVLETLLAKVQLSYTIKSDHIELHRAR